jgi:hypothetical protein
VIVYVSIGNSDDRLTQSLWSSYTEQVRTVLRRHSASVHGEWYSAPDAAYQNACFCIEIGGRDVPNKALLVKACLEQIRLDFQQDSVAWAEAPETVFV